MSLLLATRTQPNSGCGTILRVAIALGIPTAALQPAWLGADDFAPPPADDGSYLPVVPTAPTPVRQAFSADDDMPSVARDDDYVVPMLVQPSQRAVYLSWGAEDDLASVATPVVEDDGWFAPAPWATSTTPRLPVLIDEEWVAPAAAPIVEDDGYLPIVRQPLPPQLWLFSSDTAPSAALGPYLDDGVWLAPLPWASGPLPAVWLATDDLPTTSTTVVEDEGYQPPSPQPVASPARLIWIADDEIPAPLHVEDSEWQVALSWAVSPIPRAVTVDEEWVAPPGAPIVDEEPYLPPIFAPVDNRGIPHWGYEQQEEWVPQPPPIVEDEPFVPFVRQLCPPRIHVISAPAAPALAIPPTGQPDEDYYQSLVLPPPDPITLFGPWSFASGDDTSQMPDEECWRGPIIWPVPQPALSWRDDDMPSVPVVPLGVDELHWQVPVGKPFPAPQQLPWVEDDIPSLPQVPLGVDDDSFVAALLQPLPVTLFGPWSYAADEMGSALEEDLFWTPGPLPTPRAWARLVIEQPDEWPSPPVPLRVEDDCWITALTQRQLVQPTMPPALPPWFMEQHEQAADLKKPKKPRDSIIRLHVSRDGRASIWYT